MFTATIKNKAENADGNLVVTVEFTNGTKTITEQIVPQDRVGFNHWVKSRILSLTTAEELETEDNVDQPIDVSEPEVPQAELDKREWLRQFALLERLELLEAKGFLTGARLTALNNKLAETRTFLDANIKAEYLNEL